MAVPSDPTVADIILQGMQEAGQYNVTSAQAAYLNFKAYQWETIKTEIWNACRTDRLLEGDVFRVAKTGRASIDISTVTDFDNEAAVWVYDMADEYRGAVQAVSGANVTLASTFESDEDALIGAYIFFTDSSSSTRASRTIIAYNNTTKVVTLNEALSGLIVSDKYYIQQYSYPLTRNDYLQPTLISGRPTSYSRRGATFFINPHPDKEYIIQFAYRYNLSRLDESSSIFVKHLRERRHLWVQGVKVRTMAKFDDERYGGEKQIWEQMLAQYGAQNVVYAQMEGYR